MDFRELQQLMAAQFGSRDLERGAEATFLWLSEEVGELAAAIRLQDPKNLAEEFADVLAWLASLANVTKIDLANAVEQKYGRGCPQCQQTPCVCSPTEKP